MRHGHGISHLAGGKVYIGSHADDEIHGVGALLNPNGDFYYGQFANGCCEGHGLCSISNRVLRGVWSKGAMISSSGQVTDLPDELKCINTRTFPDVLTYLRTAADKSTDVTKPIETDKLGATLLVACGPAFVERFTLKKFLAQFFLFLFPIAALIRGYKNRITLAEEREYVIAGAAIRTPQSFPKGSIFTIFLAFGCGVAGLIVGGINIEHFQSVEIVDLAAPFVAWVMLAAVLSCFHSSTRCPHPMERLDRNLIPILASFCASNIDSYSPVCVYTWDVEGRTLVPNNHYMYRWAMYSFPIAAIVAMSIPFARIANEHYMFGEHAAERVTAALLFCSLFLFTFCITYYCFKVTDIQRQVLGQLRVLSSLAFVGGASVLRPTTLRNVKFNFDEEVDLRSYDSGFTGWCMTRTFLIYCSVCSNHRARSAVTTMLTIFVCAIAIAGVVDVLVSQRFNDCIYHSGHALGLAVCIVFSAMTLRLHYLAVSTVKEQLRHLYLIDLACGLAKTLRHKHAADFEACRDMVRRYDTSPELFFTPMSAWMMFVFFLVCCGGYASYLYVLVQAPRC